MSLQGSTQRTNRGAAGTVGRAAFGPSFVAIGYWHMATSLSCARPGCTVETESGMRIDGDRKNNKL